MGRLLLYVALILLSFGCKLEVGQYAAGELSRDKTHTVPPPAPFSSPPPPPSLPPFFTPPSAPPPATPNPPPSPTPANPIQPAFVEMKATSFDPEAPADSWISMDLKPSDFTLDFGRLASTDTLPVQVTWRVRNLSNSSITLSDLAIPSGFKLIADPSGGIAPGATATLTVRLDSSSAVGVQAGTLHFKTDDPQHADFSLVLKGEIR